MKEFIEKLIEKIKSKSVPLGFGLIPDEKVIRETDAISIVNQLAEEYSVTGGWIPCSSGKLPEENQEVILTFKNSAELHAGEATYKNRMFFYVTDTEFGYYEEVYKNPIAWKPKDAPYQPKGE